MLSPLPLNRYATVAKNESPSNKQKSQPPNGVAESVPVKSESNSLYSASIVSTSPLPNTVSERRSTV